MKHSPKSAKTLTQVCSLRSDNYDVGDFWILTDGPTVTISAQKLGHPVTASITVPKWIFNQMLNWYSRPTKGKP